MPSSAAELDRMEKKKKLELVQEERESGGSKDGSVESYKDSGSREGSGSSGRELGAQVPVKCYIADEPKTSKIRVKASAPGPALPIRTISVDDKNTRLSSGTEIDHGSLNYVDIKHEPSELATPTGINNSSSPKAADAAIVGSPAAAISTGVNYIKIDHEKTRELSQKGTAVSH